MKERAKNKERDNNNIIIQITLFDVTNKYKPISTLIEVESIEYYRLHKEECKRRAYQKICDQRGLTGKELVKMGYRKTAVRNYTLYRQIQEGRKERKRREKHEEEDC